MGAVQSGALPYTAPSIRAMDPHEAIRKLVRIRLRQEHELELAVERARRWKALAKKLWHEPYPNRGGTGRYGCAAIDVRMKAKGR